MTAVRNQRLHDSLQVFCLDAIEIIREAAASNDLPRRQFLRLLHPSPDQTTGFTDTEINWEGAVCMFEPLLSSRPSYGAVAAAMHSDRTVAAHFDQMVSVGLGSRRIEFDACLRGFLASVLAASAKLSFDAECFAIVYECFEDFFYSSTLDLRAVAPLYGFWSDRERIDLKDGLAIVLFADADRKRLFPQPIDFIGATGPFGFLNARYALEYVWKIPKILEPTATPVGGEGVRRTMELFERVVTALRLFQGGHVIYSHIDVGPRRWMPFRLGLAFARPASGTLVGRPYKLTGSKLDDFGAFFEWLYSLDTEHWRRIRTALRRFNLGCERPIFEDRLIDFVIALEALLLDSQGELSYRIALRGAALLGDAPTEREDYFIRLRKLYELRSRIVHGDPVESVLKKISDLTDPGQYLILVEEYIRKSITRFLALAQELGEDGVVNELDRRLVHGDFSAKRFGNGAAGAANPSGSP